MKIERINENQIRCTLTSFDLSVRDLNLGELAYGSEKAKRLFREMIQKASREVGFEADDIPLMVEAIPLSNESIMLIITKIEDPEELDTRFSKFSPMAEEEDSLSGLANELLEGADGLLELLAHGGAGGLAGSLASPSISGETDKNTEKPPEGKSDDIAPVRFFAFKNLDQVCSAARIAGPMFDGSNTLYKNPAKGRYYLVIRDSEPGSDAFKRVCNLLSEYGEGMKVSSTAEAYYQEHYEVIVKEHALQMLSAL